MHYIYRPLPWIEKFPLLTFSRITGAQKQQQLIMNLFAVYFYYADL